MSCYVVTGGHHNSALALARYFVEHGHEVYWYGHRHSSRGDQSDSAEYLEVTQAKIPFFDLPAGRSKLDHGELLQIPRGIYNAYQLLKSHKPKAVICFGGYLGAATAIAAWLLKIPVYLHEQTSVAGRASLLISRFAKRVYLTWDSSQKFFPSAQSLVVGLPLRQSLLSAHKKAIFKRRRPTLLILGGKQGAHAINQFIFSHLSSLLDRFNIIHQTGNSSVTNDYQSALEIKNNLGSYSDCYHPVGYITEDQIGEYFASCDFYLGRSGAHVTYELLLLGIRSILVPLPNSHLNEQLLNARQLVQSGLGVIIAQSKLTLPHVLVSLDQLKKVQPTPKNLPKNAVEKMYHDISNL